MLVKGAPDLSIFSRTEDTVYMNTIFLCCLKPENHATHTWQCQHSRHLQGFPLYL